MEQCGSVLQFFDAPIRHGFRDVLIFVTKDFSLPFFGDFFVVNLFLGK